jgi:hypothetical protein
MTHYTRAKRKETLLSITLTALIFSLLIGGMGWAGWHHMNKRLCERNYSPADYAEMRLDCAAYR